MVTANSAGQIFTGIAASNADLLCLYSNLRMSYGFYIVLNV